MERDLQIEELFHAALERPAGERSVFLAEACGRDHALLAEVASLLAAHNQPEDFIDAPAVEMAAALLTEPAPGSLVGRSFNHYRIMALLGAGGMGEVYLARDTQLGRKVALKLLPPHFTQDPDRLRRFIREAKSASALNHPNIITIHEIGEADGVHYIATEFIDGQTLCQRIKDAGPDVMDLREAIDFAIQVSMALAAAHAAGIVHRDIKPENIMARRDGYVKVLDFGLAKLTDRDANATNPALAMKTGLTTRPGIVMGTISYMSPEQARGLDVDARSDIFSLGIVLYEMITGSPPFVGVTTADVIAAILTQEPPSLSESAPGAFAELGRIVSKALRKDRERRYQDINELSSELKELRQELEFEAKLGYQYPSIQSDKAATASRRARNEKTGTIRAAPTGGPGVARARSSLVYLIGEAKRHKLSVGLNLAAAAVILAALGFGVYHWFGLGASDSTATTLRSVPFSSFPGSESEPVFSPDGSRIAYIWNGEKEDNYDLYVQFINAGPPLRLTDNPNRDIAPAWSPDGSHLAFTRVTGADREILLIPAMGGAERKLLTIVSANESWLAARLSWSPDGKLIAFSGKEAPRHTASIFLLSLETLEKRRLLAPPAGYSDTAPRFSPDGKTLAFIRRFGASNREVYLVPSAGGQARRLTNDNRTIDSLAWTSNGLALVFTSDRNGSSSLWRISASGGAPERLAVGGEDVHDAAISQQGNRLAYTQSQTDTNIWRWALSGSGARLQPPVKLIASTRMDTNPQYSPDGKRIVFTSSRSGSQEIWVCNSDGSNLFQVTRFGGSFVGSPRWSPDGRQIAFDCTAAGSRDIYVASVEGALARRITTEIFDEVRPSWSRDGRWFYFGSNRGGDWQVWKAPVEGGPAAQITKGGGQDAIESPDGRSVYYTISGANPGVWRVPTEGGEEVRVIDSASQGNWAMSNHGIYFLARGRGRRASVELFNFASGRIAQICEIEKDINTLGPSFSILPDAKWILCSRVDQSGSDIMLVENFR